VKLQKKHLVSLSFILSIVFHIIFGGIIWVAPRVFPNLTTPKKQRTEIEFVDATKMLEDLKKQHEDLTKLNGQIVEQDENRINDQKPKDSKFLSRHDQTVVREMQAAQHGKFKNTDQSPGQKHTEPAQDKSVTPDEQKQADTEAKPAELDPSAADQAKPAPSADLTATDTPEQPRDILVDTQNGVASHAKPKLRDLIPSFRPIPPPRVDSEDVAQGSGTGASATDDHLKNVETGNQTLLSTREFVYYSYYNRIKDKLRQYWEPKIKEKMEHILRTGRTIASSSDRITRIIIILDNTGKLVRVQVVGASGVQDLDDAAVEAFRAAAPFPNPPKGIIENDGTVKIRWDFVLEA
jgi:TonB family protein